MQAKDVIYDMPVSNHGARIRIIAKAKNLDLDILKPTVLGGLKSETYLKLNPQGKMPLFVTDEGYPIIESDPIARYLLEKFKHIEPTFIPKTLHQRALSDQICRVHDCYISSIQGCMYKAAGTKFSIYGENRKAALEELKNQLSIIEELIITASTIYPLINGPYLCGDSISLADASLFPTAIFCMFILPQCFGWTETEVLGPKLLTWYNFMKKESASKIVYDEIFESLIAWRESGRFIPIMEEMKSKSN